MAQLQEPAEDLLNLLRGVGYERLAQDLRSEIEDASETSETSGENEQGSLLSTSDSQVSGIIHAIYDQIFLPIELLEASDTELRELFEPNDKYGPPGESGRRNTPRISLTQFFEGTLDEESLRDVSQGAQNSYKAFMHALGLSGDDE